MIGTDFHSKMFIAVMYVIKTAVRGFATARDRSLAVGSSWSWNSGLDYKTGSSWMLAATTGN